LVDIGADLVVYLRTSPENVWTRVKEQAVHSVKEEQVASLEQFQKQMICTKNG